MSKVWRHIDSGIEHKLYSVEIEFSNEGKWIYRVSFFEKKKKGILFSIIGEYENLEEVLGHLKKDIALNLTFSGRGIVTKKIIKDEQFSFSIRLVLPNANDDDFFIQQYDAEEYQLVTLIRKTQIKDLVAEFISRGFLMTGINLGFPSAYSLGPILGKSEVKVPGGILSYNTNDLENITTSIDSAVDITIDQILVPNRYLLSVGNGFSYFFSKTPNANANLLPINSAEIENCNQELQYKRLTQKVGLGALAILFVILVFNHFINNYFEEKYILLEEILLSTANERQELQDLKMELQQKEELVSTTGINSNTLLSLYVDRIGSSVPEAITLSAIEVNPLLDKKLNQNEKSGFQFGKIIIGGNVANTDVLNNWVKTLKEFTWSKEVIIEKYTQKEGASKAQFTIEIHTI